MLLQRHCLLKASDQREEPVIKDFRQTPVTEWAEALEGLTVIDTVVTSFVDHEAQEKIWLDIVDKQEDIDLLIFLGSRSKRLRKRIDSVDN